MAVAQRKASPAPSIAWREFSAEAEPELWIFESSLMTPRDAQRARLLRILRANADTQFGLEHGFASMQSIHDFQTRVPVSDWSSICHWVSRAKSGEKRVLTEEHPVHFERTSGSGAQQKDIPYTNALLREFQSALVIWLATLVRDCPAIAGPSYWSISPDNSPPEKTAAGVTVGSASDASYLAGSPAEKLLSTVVGSIAPGTDRGNWQLEALRMMAAEPELRMVSVWSPTFLLSL
ncbi:MAG: GH3 auxin-responsive promoter family protein, partial [Pseudomonadales bacterium]